MEKIGLAILVVVALTQTSEGMTVGLKEGETLPEELKPIMPGGSWFDDMAVKRLQRKHHELKEHGKFEGHKHEDDSEEMFIMSKLGASHPLVTKPEVGAPIIPLDQKQDTREVMRNFLRHHAHHSHESHDDDDDEHESREGSSSRNKPSISSHGFMETYEKELDNFFKNFMSAMFQAEVRGVSIETRSDDDSSNGVRSS